MPRHAPDAPLLARRFAPEPSLALPPPRRRADIDGAAELGGTLAMDWSLERLLDRLEGRC